MTDTNCTYTDNRDETLVAYLYDDISTADRAAFEAHLNTCAACRSELAGFTSVRGRLATWVPPEPARAFSQPDLTPARRGIGAWATLQQAPAWMQLAAAVLILGVSAGAANLNIKYSSDGLSIRTGWFRSNTVQPVSPASSAATLVGNTASTMATAATAATTATTAMAAAASVSKEDLMALEQRLQTKIDSAKVGTLSDARVRVLLAESERKQQNDYALRLAGVVQESQAQRQADVVRITSAVSAHLNKFENDLVRQQNDTRVMGNAVARLVKNQ